MTDVPFVSSSVRLENWDWYREYQNHPSRDLDLSSCSGKSSIFESQFLWPTQIDENAQHSYSKANEQEEKESFRYAMQELFKGKPIITLEDREVYGIYLRNFKNLKPKLRYLYVTQIKSLKGVTTVEDLGDLMSCFSKVSYDKVQNAIIKTLNIAKNYFPDSVATFDLTLASLRFFTTNLTKSDLNEIKQCTSDFCNHFIISENIKKAFWISAVFNIGQIPKCHRDEYIKSLKLMPASGLLENLNKLTRVLFYQSSSERLFCLKKILDYIATTKEKDFTVNSYFDRLIVFQRGLNRQLT